MDEFEKEYPTPKNIQINPFERGKPLNVDEEITIGNISQDLMQKQISNYRLDIKQWREETFAQIKSK